MPQRGRVCPHGRATIVEINNFRSEFLSDGRRSQGRRLTFHTMQDRIKRMRRRERCRPHCYTARPPEPFETRSPLGHSPEDSYRVAASFRVTARLLTTGGMPQLKAPAQ
jgi:hypothetical protein